MTREALISPRSSYLSLPRLSLAIRARIAELLRFGAVGGMSFVVDVGVYNLLRLTVMDDKPIGAKVISVAIATVVAWLGNRYITFRSGNRRRGLAAAREGAQFALVNILGLGIAAVCLFVSHYLLGLHSALADNIAGNGVGLVLGTVFRYLAYRSFVFGERAFGERRSATASVPENAGLQPEGANR